MDSSVMQLTAMAVDAASPGELVVVQIDSPKPGEECVACHRNVPKIKADEAVGSGREVISLHVPRGEEGTLESMLIAMVDKHRGAWPREHAEMRQSVGLEIVGGRAWRYHAVHFATYACLMVDGLAPVEEG